jgi:uncharacterized membrane protein YfcA
MLGIGVAFAAVPLLSLFLNDLVNQVHPLSLALNGVTALFSLFGFAWARLVDWRRAWMLAVVVTLASPLGAILARISPEWMLWAAYTVAAAYFLYSMFHPVGHTPWHERFTPVLAWAVPIAVLTGYIGVGAGFLLVPKMMRHGMDIKRAAGLNAFAVTPASFATIMPHWAHMDVAASLALPLLGAGAAGALIGARLATTRMSTVALRRLLAAAIMGSLAYRALRYVFA